MKNVFKIGLYVVFNFIVMFSRAQSPDWMWVHSDGSPGVDFGMDIASDQSGNIYSVGSFGAPSINFGSFTLTNQGYGDNFLVKYDSNGSVLWAKSSGGSQYEETSTVKVDHAGNVIVAGYFYSSSINIDGVVLNNSGDEDIFIAKFNSGGTLLWAKKFGGTMLDEPRQLEVDDNDNIYMAGSFASYSLNFGIAMLVTNGDYDAFLLKLNPSGDPVWVKQAGGNSRDQAYSVTYDHHGNIYCSGEYQSSSFDFGGGALTNQGTWDAYIVKFDTSGNYNWIESFGGPGYEMGRSLVCDSSGFVYMGGSFSSDTLTDGNFSLISTGIDDIFIMKLDEFGIVQWANSIQGANVESLYGMDINKFNEIILSGGSSSSSFAIGSDTFLNSGFWDGFVSCVDMNGNFKWAKSFGGTDYDDAYGITSDPNGYVFLCGRFNSPVLNIGNNSFVNAGNGDYLFAKIDNAISGISDLSSNAKVELFPNPIKSNSILKWSENTTSIADLFFYNCYGQLVKINRNMSSGCYLNKADFIEGVYDVRLVMKNGHALSKKFVVN